MSSSSDHLVVDTGRLEKAGVQLAHIRSESDTVVRIAEAMHGSIAAPEAGLGIGQAVTAMAQAWSEGFALIGDELELLGGKVRDTAEVYVLVETTAIGTFTGHPAI